MKCEFGCGEEAIHQFKNGTWCCSKNVPSCKAIKKKISDKIKYASKYNEEYKRKQSESRKYRLIDYEKNHPFLCKIEDLREHPITKEIQTHCKNSNCKNSKEKNGWFTPTYIKLYERIRQLETDHGMGGCFLYCSIECRDSCILSYSRENSISKNDKLYTDAEYQTWRQEVFNRNGYYCEYCNKIGTHVHHIKPQKLEPGFSLDPDNGVVCCEKCHYKYGHKDECSTGQLANKECI